MNSWKVLKRRLWICISYLKCLDPLTRGTLDKIDETLWWNRSHLILWGRRVRYGDVQGRLQGGHVCDAEGVILKTDKQDEMNEERK